MNFKALMLAITATLLMMVGLPTVSTMAQESFIVSGQQIPGVTANAKRWDGFYAGVHVGHTRGTFQDVGNPDATAQDIDGFNGGVQAGYNVQLDNNVVVGVEADLTAGGASQSWSGNETNQFDPYYGSDTINGSGTVRARLGYAAGNLLPYVTGGLAVANTTHTLGCDAARVVATNGCQNKVAAFETSKNGFSVGYVIGAGVEYAVTDTVSVKAEYLYSNYGTKDVTLVDPNYPSAGVRSFNNDNHTIRVGFNVKF